MRSGLEKNFLKVAALAGIVTLLIQFTELVFIFSWLGTASAPRSGVVSGMGALTYAVFILGFWRIGGLFSNYLMRRASILLIAVHLALYGSSLLISVAPHLNFSERGVLGVLILGAAGITFGISVLRISSRLGSLATAVGTLEIFADAMLILSSLVPPVLLIFIIVNVPLYLIASLLLWRAAGHVH